MLMTSGGAAQRRVRNDLRSANAAWPEYCCHREAGCRVNEASDLLFANGRAAALAFPRREVAGVATDLVTAPDDHHERGLAVLLLDEGSTARTS
jgi:hypothetical protein